MLVAGEDVKFRVKYSTTQVEAAPAGRGQPAPIVLQETWRELPPVRSCATLASPPIQPLRPTSKDQCKDGGWRNYGVFKNQGDCVSFVATRGKNQPAQTPPH